MTDKHTKSYSTSAVTREMEVKTTMRKHPHSNDCNRKDRDEQVGKDVEKLESSYIANQV